VSAGTCARRGCGTRLETGGPGRPARFCSDACRQHEFRAIEYLARTELVRRHREEYLEIRSRIAAERQEGVPAGASPLMPLAPAGS